MLRHLTACAASLALIVQLSGCVGGGGAQGSGSSGTTGGVATLTLSMTDPTTGANKTSVSAGDGAIIKATVKDSSGQPVERALVAFTASDATLATLIPPTGTALTGTDGVASVRLDAASISSAGAAKISASSVVGSGSAAATVTGDMNFGVGAAGVLLSNMSANLTGGAASLSPYATTRISVSVGGVPASTSVPIDFTSTCSATGKATVTARVNSQNGTAIATYADNGCASTDVITASVAGTSVTASLQLPVAAPSASAIQFVSASPSTIAIKGTGGTGLVGSSTVIFKLVDNSGQPIAGQTVTLGLTTRSGGILLNSAASGTVDQTTDSAGEVRVRVESGTTPTAVWVTASHTVSPGLVLQTQSTALQISTGRPAQDRFTFSVKTWNIEGLYINGTETEISVIASDRVGNPVPDGTAINFISSGGQIGSSSFGVCSTVNGTCSAVYKSASPRPSNGRVQIVAYAIGEEKFTDANANNVYDAGEAFEDLGEVYVDNNFDRAWATGEQAIAFNNTTSGCTSVIAGTEYAPSKAGTCDGVWGAAHVRKENIIVLSGRDLSITAATTTSPGSSCRPATANFFATDENQNPLPAGTTLSVSNLPNEGWAVTIEPSTVPNSAAVGIGSKHQVTFTPDATNCGSVVGFSAFVTAKTPSGFTSTASNQIVVQGGQASAPGAPATGLLTAGAGGSENVSIAFTAPVDTGGTTISFFTATCSGAGATTRSNTAASSPIVVTMTGDAGDTVSCTVTATNGAGLVSPASAASNSVVVP